jgi:hypothetical protein
MAKELELYKYIVKAQILEPTDEEYAEVEDLSKGFFVASAAPFENGRPKMLFIKAWIAHEGRNLNGDAFVAKELEARVNAGLFAPPYAGMIDYDHDFTARGFWYKTSYAFDERANKWGILATGGVWAWRYPDLVEFANEQMQKQGYINVSMAAIPEVRETVVDYPNALGQQTNILHNPVFFTSAILSVPPGDPDAKGITTTVEAAVIESQATNITREGSPMPDEIKTEIETLKATVAQLQQDNDALKIKLTEAEVNLETVTNIKAGLENEFGAVKAELQVYKDKESVENESKKVAAEEAKFAARLAKVPDVVKKNLEKHANKDLVLAKWKDVSDEDWTTIEQGFALAYSAPTYLVRSQEEGKLPVAHDELDDKDLSRFLKD